MQGVVCLAGRYAMEEDCRAEQHPYQAETLGAHSALPLRDDL